MTNGLSRKLAVIMHADVVSSARLVHLDETLAHERIRGTFQRFSDTIRLYNGVAHEIRGDALVAEFPMASDAVCASLAFQEANAAHLDKLEDDVRPVVRVGIAMGEVVVADHMVTGDGVVLAQRLEQLAEPGGVVIQGAAHETVPKRLPFDYDDMGELALKGFDELVRAFAVKLRPGAAMPQPESHSQGDRRVPDLLYKVWPTQTTPASLRRRRFTVVSSIAALLAIAGIWVALTPFGEDAEKSNAATKQADIPSIFVMPFVNRSDEPEQDYFVDGITEDIITDFSRLSNLTVIAWNTSSSFRGGTVQPQELKKAFGVDYVLDGSMRKSGDQLRITAQLVDASNGKQVWAERYDRRLEDVFALQDDVTKKIVQALAVKLTAAEKGQLGRPATNNFAAYETFLRGQQYFRQQTKEGNELARETYMRAIELDPSYARAYGALALTHVLDFRSGWTDAPNETLDRALALAEQAVALGNDIPQTHWALGFVYLFRKQYAEAEAAALQTIKLAPSYADGYGLLAFVNNWQGKAEDAARNMRKAMALNPYYTYEYPWTLGLAYFFLGRYPEAVEAMKDALEHNANAPLPRLFLAAAYIRLGRQDDAEWEIDQVMILYPNTTLFQVATTLPLSNRDQINAILGDLRKAGLPD